MAHFALRIREGKKERKENESKNYFSGFLLHGIITLDKTKGSDSQNSNNLFHPIFFFFVFSTLVLFINKTKKIVFLYASYHFPPKIHEPNKTLRSNKKEFTTRQ